LIPKFASEGAARSSELRNRDTRNVDISGAPYDFEFRSERATI
jgi:hypothetical protein